MLKVFIKSGLSASGTYLPKCIHPVHVKQADTTLVSAFDEAEAVM